MLPGEHLLIWRPSLSPGASMFLSSPLIPDISLPPLPITRLLIMLQCVLDPFLLQAPFLLSDNKHHLLLPSSFSRA